MTSMAKRIKDARNNMGAPFKVGSSVCRRVERPEDIGLSLVGFADEVASRSVEHRGWYLNDDYSHELARGVVYETRGKHRHLIAGMADPNNDGPAILEFVPLDHDDTIGAAHSADAIAERYAENERDHNRAWIARFKYEDLGEEVKQNRSSVLALIGEIKQIRSTLCDHAAIAAALREKIGTLLDDIKDARDKRSELESGFSRESGWQDY